MKRRTLYRYTFSDGHVCICMGLSAQERRAEEAKHGRLVSKTVEGEV